jgi:creatinine amidohydrolase
MTVLWGEHTAPELAEAGRAGALAILPLGCTEQHAEHLPVDTDTYQVERLCRDGARAAAERHGVRALVLPALPFGPASEHYGLPGTLGLSNELWIGVIKQLLWSVLDAGFTRVAAVKGCGGHWALPGALWDVKADARRAGRAVTLRMLAVDADWRAIQEELFPGADGGHAAVMETALCLAERAQLVRLDAMRAPRLADFRARYVDGGEIFLFDEMTDTGALGDPGPATSEGGAAAWQLLAERFAERLKLIDEQDRALGRL